MKLYEKINFSGKIQDRFTELAKYLFFNCYLLVRNQKFYFTDLEFYYYDKQDPKFQDPFCLCQEDQQPGKPGYPFCFHKYGMDIIIGTRQAYGGTLIRGLKDETGHFIEGTQRLFTWILPLIDEKLIDEMYDMKKHAPLLKEAVKNKELQLVSNIIVPAKPVPMQQGPRVVGTRKEDKDLKFQLSPFRYLIDTDKYSYKPKEKIGYVTALLADSPDQEKFKAMAEKRMKSSDAKTAKEWRTLVNYYEKLMAD